MGNVLKCNKISEISSTYNEMYPHKCWALLAPFLQNLEAVILKKGLNFETQYTLIIEYANLVLEQLKSPYQFGSFHKASKGPYLRVGTEIFRPLIDFARSQVEGEENMTAINDILAQNENVILFANHQIEADPQVLFLLLEETEHHFIKDTIFVAGGRVLSDPLAAPFSRGINLLSVFSKKYFESYPEKLTEMREHNNKTIRTISQLLDEGGKSILVFPSGGRDRPDENGVVQVAPFDPQSTELFYLLGKKAKVATHFFPLALSTHDILPPPKNLQIALGERRSAKEAPIHLHVGKEIDMENFPVSDTKDRKKLKDVRAEYICSLVRDMYNKFPG